MKRAFLCLVASAVVVGCGQIARVPTGATVSASRQTPPTASASATPSALPSSSPNAAIEVLSTTSTNGDTTIHLLTITGGSATDRFLLTHLRLSVLDANIRIALIATYNPNKLETLDLNTGAIREVGVTSPWGIGPGVLSPDGTQAAVAMQTVDLTSYEILVVDLASGAFRTLLQLPTSSYNRAGLDPIRWTSTGILVSPGRWDGPRHTLLNLDPQSAQLTTLMEAQVDVLSPDATMIAAASHANLGDGPFGGQGEWPNRLTVGPVGGPSAVIAERTNRAFTALDVAKDGSVIYAADDSPSSTAAPTPDMGLNLETGGRSVLELGETRVGQWQAAKFIGNGMALAASQTAGGAEGTVEIYLVNLCIADGGCTPTIQLVETDSGMYPFAGLIVLSGY